jgi:hypothetical protein
MLSASIIKAMLEVVNTFEISISSMKHGATSQKTDIFIHAAVKTSNAALGERLLVALDGTSSFMGVGNDNRSFMEMAQDLA